MTEERWEDRERLLAELRVERFPTFGLLAELAAPTPDDHHAPVVGDDPLAVSYRRRMLAVESREWERRGGAARARGRGRGRGGVDDTP